jgi:hypothetical protein
MATIHFNFVIGLVLFVTTSFSYIPQHFNHKNKQISPELSKSAAG